VKGAAVAAAYLGVAARAPVSHRSVCAVLLNKSENNEAFIAARRETTTS
jgi:hypothetical protein